MAVTQDSFTGNGTKTDYDFTFPYLKQSEIKASLDGTPTTNFRHLTATKIQFVNNTTANTPTAPADGVKIKIYRETDTSSLAATFYAGSAIKSEDLNDNFTQNVYATQEVTERYLSNLGGTMTGDLNLGEDVIIKFEGASDNAHETILTVVDPTADRTITLPNETGTVITSAGTDVIDSAHYVAGSIDLEHMSANSVDSDQYVDGSIDLIHMSANSVDSDQYVDGSIDHVHLSNNCIDGDNIQDDVINSEHYAAGSIDLEHMSANSVDSDQYVDGSIDLIHMSANSVDSDQYVDGSVDHIHLSNDCIDGDNIQDDAVNSEHIAAGAVDLEHMSANSVDSDQYVDGSIDRIHLEADIIDATKIEDDAVTTDHIADPELVTLAGMQSGTASRLADSTALTATTAELNILDNKSFRASGDGALTTTSDTEIPSSKVVANHVAAQLGTVGGFTTIATEVAFPATASQPAAGVIISISDAAGIVVSGSSPYSSTTGRTVDGTPATVTINNFPSSLAGETLASGVGLLVTSTGSSNTYTYHKLLAAESDVKQLSDDINDFNARYRVAGSAPGSNNDEGDLYFDTSANKMKVYNGSSWDDVASVGNFYINTISSSSNTGGGSATFNGSAYRFTLSNPPTMAQQLIVSVNGVLQKPDAGTGQPSEGFAINGNDIIFSAAPASGSDYFIVTQGSSVSIGTPSDNTVSTAKIQNLAVDNTKIANDSIAEVKLDIHNTPASGKYLKYTSNGMEWADGASEGTDVKSTGESGTTKFLRTDGDGTSSWQVPPDTVYTHPNHSGEVTSSADGAQTIASNVVDEDNLKVSNSPTNGQFLQAQSGNTGGLTWADVSSSPTIEATASGSIGAGKAVVINSSGQVKEPAQTFTAEDPVDDSSSGNSNEVNSESSASEDGVSDPTPPAYDPLTGRCILGYMASNAASFRAGKINATDTAAQFANQGYWTYSSSTSQRAFNVGENKFISFYRGGTGATTKLNVVTLSGLDSAVTQSVGATVVLCGGGYRHAGSYANMGNGLGVLLHWLDGGGICSSVIQVANNGTGTTLTSASSQTVNSNGEGENIEPTCFKHSSGNVVACYRENNSGTRTWKSRGGSVSSGDTTVSWGTEVALSTTTKGNLSMVEAGTGGNQELIAMYYLSNEVKYKVGTLSGTTISWGSEQTLLTSSNTSNLSDFCSCCWDNSSGRLGIIYTKGTGNSQQLYVCSASLSSGTLTKNTNHEEGVHAFNNGNYPNLEDEYDVHIAESSFTNNVFIYGKGRNTYSGDNRRRILLTTATLGSISTELTTLEYVGISSAAYTNGQTATIDVTGGTNTAVSGLTPGSKYYVQGDGSLSTSTATPLIKAGLAISATKLLVKE